jgi:C-terminal processing protease CtpA/Prc
MAVVTTTIRSTVALVAVSLLFLTKGVLHATQFSKRISRPASTTARTARLFALARLDAAVHYFHPTVATRPSRWDSSFASLVVDVADASDSFAYAAAVARLLATLGDPQTRIARTHAAWGATRQPDGSLFLKPSGISGLRDTLHLVEPAPTVVIDLRDNAPDLPSSVLRLLKGTWSANDERRLQYAGLPQVWSQSVNDAHRLTWQRVPGRRFEGTAPTPVQVSVLVSDRTVLPPLVQAMMRDGAATLIGERATQDALATTTERIDMGEGVWADVRVGEALEKASSSVDTVRRVFLPGPPTDPAWRAPYPARGYRILAAARLWSTIDLFFPYTALMNEDWDAGFVQALDQVENAADASGFASALVAFAWRTHDSHVRITNRTLFRERAPVPLALQLRIVEGRLIVTGTPNATASALSVRVGDEIVAVDGVPIRKVIHDLEPTLIASSPQGLRALVQAHVLDGREGTIPRITIRRPNSLDRVVVLPKRHDDASRLLTQSVPTSTSTAYRTLDKDIGYVDLALLGPEEVDQMFRALANTKAIVFDGRGYPRGTAWALAGRLNRRLDQRTAAELSQHIVRGPRVKDTPREIRTWSQPVPIASIRATRYWGRTVLLIDERAMSQAEHLGLFLKEANGTDFVGSPTVGANGDISDIALPGSFRVSFTGLEVRDARGGQLQRVGLQPDVSVTPTVSGIRANRDEVLEAAIRLLRDKLQ